MHVCLTEPARPATAVTPNEKRRRFISAYWLRPENALWTILRSEALAGVPWRSPCIDLSCGDGVFTFLHCGGRFVPDFDVYHGVGHLDRVHSDQVDMFDHVGDGYAPEVIAPPAFRIDCGTDAKKSMLIKASRLHCYDRLVLHNHNKPLPLKDGLFETVYCNAPYWVERVDLFLSELRRITRPGGGIILQVKLDGIRECTFNRHERVLGRRWLDIIDRGRAASWPSLTDRSSWERRFQGAGLEITRVTPLATRTHAHIWDVGLRPIAPWLIRAMNEINPHLRAEIKKDWVDLFCRLLEPFCTPDLDLLNGSADPVELQYELTPTG